MPKNAEDTLMCLLQPEQDINEFTRLELSAAFRLSINLHGQSCGTAVSQIASHIRNARDRADVVLAVLSVPHPAYVEALFERFGETVFEKLNDRQGEPESPYIHFSPCGLGWELETALTNKIYRLIIASASDYAPTLNSASRHYRRGDRIEEFLDLCDQIGLSRKDRFSNMLAIGTFSASSPKFTRWAASLFDEFSRPDCPRSRNLIQESILFGRPHVVAAAIASGMDLNQVSATHWRFTAAWLQSLRVTLKSSHGRLTILSRLSRIGPTDAIFTTEAEALKVILGSPAGVTPSIPENSHVH